MPTKAKKPTAPGFRLRSQRLLSSFWRSVTSHKILAVVLVLIVGFLVYWQVTVFVDRMHFHNAEVATYKLARNLGQNGIDASPVKSCTRPEAKFGTTALQCGISISLYTHSDEANTKSDLLSKFVKSITDTGTLIKTKELTASSVDDETINIIYSVKDTEQVCNLFIQPINSVRYELSFGCVMHPHFPIY